MISRDIALLPLKNTHVKFHSFHLKMRYMRLRLRSLRSHDFNEHKSPSCYCRLHRCESCYVNADTFTSREELTKRLPYLIESSNLRC